MQPVILDRQRIRRIDGGFGFIPHRFLNDGFFASLSPEELVLYFFWVLAADRFGMSFYGDASICRHTAIRRDALDELREKMAAKNLIAFSSPFVQLLALPPKPPTLIPKATPPSFSDKSVENHADRRVHPISKILKSLEGERS